jgi:hypothetical protein
MAHYHVEKRGKAWRILRLDQPCTIATIKESRRAAIQIARLLAGFRGVVTIENGKHAR